MDEFDRKMKFLDDVLVNWEEDKESQLVTNEPATVIDNATIQDDLGCELLNQGEEVAETRKQKPWCCFYVFLIKPLFVHFLSLLIAYTVTPPDIINWVSGDVREDCT